MEGRSEQENLLALRASRLVVKGFLVFVEMRMYGLREMKEKRKNLLFVHSPFLINYNVAGISDGP